MSAIGWTPYRFVHDDWHISCFAPNCMYDCMTVYFQDSVQRKIPILLCANKSDLRIATAADGKRCVQKEDGEKLAKVGAAFAFVCM